MARLSTRGTLVLELPRSAQLVAMPFKLRLSLPLPPPLAWASCAAISRGGPPRFSSCGPLFHARPRSWLRGLGPQALALHPPSRQPANPPLSSLTANSSLLGGGGGEWIFLTSGFGVRPGHSPNPRRSLAPTLLALGSLPLSSSPTPSGSRPGSLIIQPRPDKMQASWPVVG